MKHIPLVTYRNGITHCSTNSTLWWLYVSPPECSTTMQLTQTMRA